MQSSLTPPSSAARFASRLVLALALCACGGGGDADAAAPARSADATASAARAAGDCPAPPVVDPARFKGPWEGLSRYIVGELGATFPDEVPADSNTARVRLCPNCELVRMTILPEATTYCTQPGQLDGGQRLMGILVLKETFTGSDSTGWQTIQANDSIFMFASRPDGPATMVYESDGRQVVVAPDTSWMFYYCTDAHGGTRPEAKWRSRSAPGTTGQTAGKGKGGDDDDDDDDDDDGGNTYGWMACASGCCQFYTPPPNPIMTETPDNASPRAPDTVGKGRNQAASPGARPSWCVKAAGAAASP
jgi:hypothetical protein